MFMFLGVFKGRRVGLVGAILEGRAGKMSVYVGWIGREKLRRQDKNRTRLIWEKLERSWRGL